MNHPAKNLPTQITIAESISFVLSINTKTNEVRLDIDKADLDRATDKIVKLVSLMASFNFISKEIMALTGIAIKTPNDYYKVRQLEPIQKALGIIVNEEAGRLFWENRYILEKYAGNQDPETNQDVKPNLEIVKKPN